MKGGITLLLVIFAFITIGDVDALKCYQCDGESRNEFLDKVCHGDDDLGKLVECTGHCMKKMQPKTGDEGCWTCLCDIDCQLIPKFFNYLQLIKNTNSIECVMN